MRSAAPPASTGAGTAANRGFALLAVLWITTCLAAIAMGFAVSARLKGTVALNNRQAVIQTQLLHSGLTIGYHNYLTYRLNRSAFLDKERRAQLEDQGVAFWYPRFEPYRLAIEGTELNISITDPLGKIDIHAVSEADFDKILRVCGVTEKKQRTGIINSVQDWVDSDEFHRIEGAENKYYQGLDPPYHCKNAPLESIEELLLIKGIDQELFAGGQDKPGLGHFFNVMGKNAKLEINCAPPQTFALLGDLPGEVVEGIAAKRGREPIPNLNALTDVVPYGYYDVLTRYFTTGRSRLIHVQSGLRLESGRTGRKLSVLHRLE